MATSKNAKKRQQARRAQQRRQAAGTTTSASRSGATATSAPGRSDKAVAKAVADEFPPASSTPIEPTGSGSSAPAAIEDDDGPGFTPVRRGAANTVIIAVVLVAMVVALLVLVVR